MVGFEAYKNAGFNYKSALVFFIIVFAVIRGSLAQSDNYWSWTFNTPSMLVAGSVVGGGAGPSAIYFTKFHDDGRIQD